MPADNSNFEISSLIWFLKAIMTAIDNRVVYGIFPHFLLKGRLNISVGTKHVMCQQKKGGGQSGRGGGGSGY